MTGFISRSTTTISHTGTIFTLAPTGTDFSVYIEGVKKTISSSLTKTFAADTAGLYFAYITSAGALAVSTTEPSWGTNVSVATMYWNGTAIISMEDHRHLMAPDYAIKQDLEHSQGTPWKSGFDLSGYTIDGDGSQAERCAVEVENGTIMDSGLEDVATADPNPTADSWEQCMGTRTAVTDYNVGTQQVEHDASFDNTDIAGKFVDFYTVGGVFRDTDLVATRDDATHFTLTNGIAAVIATDIIRVRGEFPVYYRNGNPAVWTKQDDCIYPFWVTENNPATHPSVPTTRPRYNRLNAGAWNAQETTDGYFIATFGFATRDPYRPFIWIMGQREDVSLLAARQNNKFEDLSWGTYKPFLGMRLCYRLIYQISAAYTGSCDARLRDIVDYRKSPTGGEEYTPMSHDDLADTDTSGHPASVIENLPVPGKLRGNHEDLDHNFVMDAGTEEWVEFYGKLPADYDYENQTLVFHIEASWDVAPGAGVTIASQFGHYGTAGTITVLPAEAALVMTNAIANQKFTVDVTIAANHVAAGEEVRFRINRDNEATAVTLRIHDISAEMV